MTDSTQTTAVIEENQALWHTDRRPVGCSRCHRVFLAQESFIDKSCPLCRSGKLEPQPARMRPAEPEQMLPFRVNLNQLNKIFQGFVSGVWIKPEDFRADLLLKRTVPIFWPMWQVDSDIIGHWQMEAGFDYQVESAKESYVSGQWQSKKEIETRTRWEPRLGHLETHVANVIIPALEEHRNRQAITGPYPHDRAIAFDPNSLGKALLEVPDLPPEDAWPMAKPQVDQTAGEICTRAAGAQHHRNFAIEAAYENLNWTEFFLPMFTTFYTDDDGQPQILVVNGETGRIAGPRLASRKKGLQIAGILAGIAGLAFLLTLFGLLLTIVFPPAGIIAALLGVLGVILGIAAIIPAVWPGQWNRKQDGPRVATRR